MNDSQGRGLVTGLLFGAVVGAGVALLMAPAAGSDTRRRLVKASDDLRQKAGAKLASLRGRTDVLKDEIQGTLGRVGDTVREGARDVGAAVNEGYNAYQKAANDPAATTRRS